MANIRSLIGHNPSTGTARLLAAYGNDIVNVATNTGYGLAINGSNDVEFEKYLDRVFFQNYSEKPLTYNTTTNVWTNEHVGRTPIAKYQKVFNSRLFLGYCQFINPQAPLDTSGNAPVYSSRVFYSDLFSAGTRGVSGPQLTWGLEWGRNGLVQPNTNNFYLQTSGVNYPLNQDFKVRNIKVGDPLTIIGTDTPAAYGELIKTHLVTSVDSAYRLVLNTTFTGLSNGALIDYWVGSNWFDVSPDDGDVITGFGKNSSRLLIFKLLSLWIYTGTQLLQVKGAPGTSYNRSIINDKYDNTYYFHGSDPKISGIYKYNGVSSVKISRAIDPWISAMSVANYSSVIAWQEGNELRFYLGNLSANNYIDAINNAVATYNVDTGAFSIDPIQDTITSSTIWRASSNQQDSYVGNSANQVIKMSSGYNMKGTAFSSYLQTKVFYPAGSEVICDFLYVQIIGRFTRGTRVKYKLWNFPKNVDLDWMALGELDGDRTEFTIPLYHQTAAGIQFQFDELGTAENDTYIEKISIFYKPNRVRVI